MTLNRFLNPFHRDAPRKAPPPVTLIIDQNFTKNCEARPEGKAVEHLILHYTGCPARVASARFLDNTPNLEGGRLSTHYMVDENGRITQFVHEKMRAWHAGKSYWRGEADINSTSIGIEIVNMGEYGGYPDFNQDQIAVVIELCRDILSRHPGITPLRVLGHSDIAPGRKLDPGPKFPWAQFAAAGVGYFPGVGEIECHPGGAISPSPTARGRDGAGDTIHPSDPAVLDQMLTQFGYNPDVPLDDRVDAFCTHYAPEILRTDDRHALMTVLNDMVQIVQGTE